MSGEALRVYPLSTMAPDQLAGCVRALMELAREALSPMPTNKQLMTHFPALAMA